MTATAKTEQPEFLDTDELSARWNGKIKKSTLMSWRSNGDGPPYHKIGGRVLYRRCEVEEWEKTHRRLASDKSG